MIVINDSLSNTCSIISIIMMSTIFDVSGQREGGRENVHFGHSTLERL